MTQRAVARVGGRVLDPCRSPQNSSFTSLFWTPRYNSAKKDNDFIYHEAVPALDTLQPVKGLTLRGGRGSRWGCRG